ncbi:MAG: HAMP domain-containing histidine kinase [Candidatus Latescibacteria bacterium]|nr:HAMP domain-containing histidine kinase [Candidatus Latescibacterota bacterium]
MNKVNDSKLQRSKKSSSLQEPFIWRPKWFLAMRFFAVIGVVVALIFAQNVYFIHTFNYTALWILTIMLLVCNLLYVLFYLYGCRNHNKNDFVPAQCLVRFTKIQINVDLLLLTLMLHFSGGATNPFIFYYFFHPLLSSILLSKKAAYVEALVASCLFFGMTLLEGYGILRHYNLFSPAYYSQTIFMAGIITAVISALFIAVYMATSIMDRLRLHQGELEVALDELKRLEAEKSRFLDVVAHDLKSPIAAIETMINSILAVHGNSLDPKIRQALQRIPNRTHDLILFIRELLEFSRIKNLNEIHVEFKKLNFLPIVTATVEMYMNQALEKNIKMTVQADQDIPQIYGHKDHLERLAANLISNAIRYTPDNGSVNVKIGMDKNEIILTVSDTGIGIPEDALPNIFTEFFRASNAKKFTSSGTGLGMSITKTIVEQHCGTISVQSHEGEGTAFTVKFPAASPQNNINKK